MGLTLSSSALCRALRMGGQSLLEPPQCWGSPSSPGSLPCVPRSCGHQAPYPGTVSLYFSSVRPHSQCPGPGRGKRSHRPCSLGELGADRGRRGSLDTGQNVTASLAARSEVRAGRGRRPLLLWAWRKSGRLPGGGGCSNGAAEPGRHSRRCVDGPWRSPRFTLLHTLTAPPWCQPQPLVPILPSSLARHCLLSHPLRPSPCCRRGPCRWLFALGHPEVFVSSGLAHSSPCSDGKAPRAPQMSPFVETLRHRTCHCAPLC